MKAPSKSKPTSPAKELLKTYQAKRDFKKTKEPRGSATSSDRKSSDPIFVVQKHNASHLHYDFRLEIDGVLKSWAVPKEPQMDPAVKRLAVPVEDHPLEYASFEGDIPEGEYGGGHVEIWDSGHWKADASSSEADVRAAFEKGKLVFHLKGKKLQGKFTLVKSALSGGKGKKGWLLIKNKDEFAKTSKAKPSKIKSETKTVQRKTKIEFDDPQLAVLVDRAPSGDGWIFESKFDGYRLLSSLRGKKLRLLSRNGNDWSNRFGAIYRSLSRLPAQSALIDGEIVALNDKGVSDFQALQNSLVSENSDRLRYYVFDLLELNGEDLRSLPLYERKRRLKALLERCPCEQIQMSDHITGDGQTIFEQACKQGLEGIICKRMESPYREGRSGDWLKVKCVARQEFVIVGYTKPKGKRERFGALLLATRYKTGDGSLSYAGKVGTGFTQACLDDLFSRFQKLKAARPPLERSAKDLVRERDVHWLKPELVAEISFTGWTNDQIVRHPSFLGLREDKPADEVRVEKPKKIESIESALSSEDGDVRLTHPDRVLYPDQGITKQDLADYYALVGERMLKFSMRRPLTLVRCPQGEGKTCFFQKNYKEGMGPGISPIYIEGKEKSSSQMQLDSAIGLQSLVQHGALEIHTWGSRAEDLERPDQLVFDFDPDPCTSWEEVVSGIKELKKVLEGHGLIPFLKLSGGKGVHIHVPIVAEYSWDEVHEYSAAIAAEMEKRNPDTFTANPLKKERRGKLYLDYVRNSRGVSFVAPYSTRAREGAPIALPIHWSELSVKLKPNEFTVSNIANRLRKSTDDPWAKFFESARMLDLESVLAAGDQDRKTKKAKADHRSRSKHAKGKKSDSRARESGRAR